MRDYILPEANQSRSAKNHRYITYKHGAVKRGLPFEISRQRFIEIVSDNCEYCGCAPVLHIQIRSGGKARRKAFYNGIDRVDNSKGYIEGNVVPCCKCCNYGKHTMTKEEYIAHCKRVAEKHA